MSVTSAFLLSASPIALKQVGDITLPANNPNQEMLLMPSEQDTTAPEV